MEIMFLQTFHFRLGGFSTLELSAYSRVRNFFLTPSGRKSDEHGKELSGDYVY